MGVKNFLKTLIDIFKDEKMIPVPNVINTSVSDAIKVAVIDRQRPNIYLA